MQNMLSYLFIVVCVSTSRLSLSTTILSRTSMRVVKTIFFMYGRRKSAWGNKTNMYRQIGPLIRNRNATSYSSFYGKDKKRERDNNFQFTFQCDAIPGNRSEDFLLKVMELLHHEMHGAFFRKVIPLLKTCNGFQMGLLRDRNLHFIPSLLF